ncbi:MAG TPA: TonB family protein [Bryobacteraceae bacterium]|nr:TonB family protein [Bryobacteraceae bacterium]
MNKRANTQTNTEANTQADNGPNLLLDWRAQTYAPRYGPAAIGSLAVHVIVLLFLTLMLDLPAPAPPPDKEIARVIHRVTPLVAPHFRLTQKDPNKAKPTQELSADNLASQQATRQAAYSRPRPAIRKFEAPQPQLQLPPTPKFNEPPQIQAKTNSPVLTPQVGAINVPAPKVQPKEEPKLAFEAPGQQGSAPIPGRAKIAPPKTGVDDAIKSVARRTAPGSTTLPQIDPAPNLPDSARTPQVDGSLKVLPELLSDPQGADFKPYIVQVLYLVKRNWLAVYPESANLGRRGVATLQFIVDRNGQVVKLVIASTSGAYELDRAAVAGVSASQPLPPFPPSFQGNEVRLQFSFKYNMQ